MAIQPADVQYERSRVRNEEVEVSRLYEDGFLYLKGDPGVWIQSNPGGLLSSLRSLELDLWCYREDRIGDSIGELSQLTHLSHLYIMGGVSLKCLPNTISRLQNLHHLELCDCRKLQELPANLGDLDNLTSLTLNRCCLLKSLPSSVAKVSKLTTLFLDRCDSLHSLPWSITKLSKLRFLYLPMDFILETLPPHMNDSVIIYADSTHVRKTWKELKTEIQFPIIPVELAEEAALNTSAPGYLRFKQDPTPWIRANYDLLSSVRVLDLELEYGSNIPDSIGELPQLTHLYITHGCLHRLSLPFYAISHLSLFRCTFECDTESHFGWLSNLVSLNLQSNSDEALPEHMDFPISLRHLTLARLNSLSANDSCMVSMAKLTNLETLNLCCCFLSKPFRLYSKLNKLILRHSFITSVPIGLKHLEIIHGAECANGDKPCDLLQECLNQGVKLETLSCTCYTIKSFSIVKSQHNLRVLRLKDCFSLKELPQNLDAIKNLCSLNVSGSRIKSLYNSVTNLHKLRLVILPKCFNLKSLPCDFENKVKISVDDTHESYYNRKGYYSFDYETSSEEDSSISDSEMLYEEDPDPIGGVNEIVLEESRQEAIIESGSSCRPLNRHVPDDSQIVEGSHFTGRKDPISNNNYHAFSNSLNHKTEFLPTENEDGIVPSCQQNECLLHFQENTLQVQNSIIAEPSSNIPETILCGENSREGFQNGRMDNFNLELEQGVALFDSLNSVHAESNYDALENRQDTNSQSGYVKHKTQKKQIPLERIRELMSQNLKLKDAAEKHLGGSHFTGGNNAVDEDNPHALCSLQYEEIETLPLSNRDCSVTSVSFVHEVAAGSSLNLHKTVSFCENGQEAFQCGKMDNINLEMEQGITPCSLMNSVDAGSSYPTLENEQDRNARRGKVKNKTQKIEITLESIQRLLRQNIRLIDAAEQLNVSRSTMKRALTEYGITWPQSGKRKVQDANKDETHNTKSSCGRYLLQLNSTDPSNPSGHDQMVEHLDGPNQLSLSNCLPSEPNVVNYSTSDAVIRTAEEPQMSAQCHTDDHQCVEEQSNGVKECAMLNTVQLNGSGPSTFVVKATYNKDSVRFDFSLSSSIEQLKKEVGKRFELEVSKFKMSYQDEYKEWMLMTCVSDLQHALQISKSSGNNAVRLLIKKK